MARKTPAQAAALDRCVADLEADPNFKPRRGDKRSAAFAVCTLSVLGRKRQDESLLDLAARLTDVEYDAVLSGVSPEEIGRMLEAARERQFQDAKVQNVSVEGMVTEADGHRHVFMLNIDLDGRIWGHIREAQDSKGTPHVHSVSTPNLVLDPQAASLSFPTGAASLGNEHIHSVEVKNPLLVELKESLERARLSEAEADALLTEEQRALPDVFRQHIAGLKRVAAAKKILSHVARPAWAFSDAISTMMGADGPSADEISFPILREGKFKHPVFGELVFDEKKFKKFIENFEKRVVGRDISTDVSHEPDKGATGWLKGLSVSEEEIGGKKAKVLNAKLALTPWGRQVVKDKIFRYFSVEFTDNFTDSKESGKSFGPTIVGGGFTNRPFITGLKPVTLSEDGLRFEEFQEEEASMGDTKLQEGRRRFDPQAKTRNRPGAVLPHTHPRVKDNADHFPIDTLARARNAVARVNQFDAAPPWFSGSLAELQRIVRRAVKRRYPSINVTGLSEEQWAADLAAKEDHLPGAVPDEVFVSSVRKSAHEMEDVAAEVEERTAVMAEHLDILGQILARLEAADTKGDEKEISALEDEAEEISDAILDGAFEDGRFVGLAQHAGQALLGNAEKANGRRKSRKRQSVVNDMARAMNRMPMMGEPPKKEEVKMSEIEAQKITAKLDEVVGKYNTLAEDHKKMAEQTLLLVEENKRLKDERYRADVDAFCSGLLREGHLPSYVGVVKGILLSESGRATTIKLSEGGKETSLSMKDVFARVLGSIPKESLKAIIIPDDATVLSDNAEGKRDADTVTRTLKYLAEKGIGVKGLDGQGSQKTT